MTTAPTLGEVLAWAKEHAPISYPEDLHVVTRDLEASLYGTLSTCPECEGSGNEAGQPFGLSESLRIHHPCPRCQGNGEVRTGGLVERVTQAVKDSDLAWDIAIPTALRAELGEGPPA